jgi:hypothetical protein
MRIAKTLGVLGLAVVAVGTSLITSQIYGQHASQKHRKIGRSGLDAATQTRVSSVGTAGQPTARTVVTDSPLPAVVPGGVTTPPIFSYDVDTFEVHVDGHDVYVKATVKFFDLSPAAKRFFWTIRVFPTVNPKTLVYQKHYTEQSFDFVGPIMNPVFSERLQLGPGSYRVQVILHGVPRSVDFSVVDRDDLEAQPYRCLSVARTISVTD